MEINTILSDLRKEILKRTRFDKAETIIDNLTNDELTASIYDALDDLNSIEPATEWKLDEVYLDEDTRRKRLLLLGASKNAIHTLIFDWTANGSSSQIDDFQIENKLSDFNSLFQLLNDEFQQKVEKFKAATQKVFSIGQFNPMPSRRKPEGSATAMYKNRFGYWSSSYPRH